jgi:hypothetical protein
MDRAARRWDILRPVKEWIAGLGIGLLVAIIFFGLLALKIASESTCVFGCRIP